jgi:DNA-binding response OmpR family regulator
MAQAKILIVDDDQDIRRLLGIRLKARGYEPFFAGDAISAVNQARKEHPDLILLDLMLPAGDGYLVVERLKAMPALEGIPSSS